MNDVDQIRDILNPASVAVIGASPNPGSFGERAVRQFNRLSYGGQVYCVNPKYDEIGGFGCFRSVNELPGQVDTAVVSVSREHVPGVIRDLGDNGCRGAVILSSGFGGPDPHGDALQDELLTAASDCGIRLFGPNTNGLVNVVGRVPLGVSSVMDREHLLKGNTAVLAQSGSLAAAFADSLMESGTGISYVLGMGNSLDLGFPHMLDFLAVDRQTQVVLIFLEGLREPDSFFAGLEQMRDAGKSVIVLKVGRSDKGKAAAATHSGAIAGSWDAFQAMAAECGAIVAETPEEALSICSLAARSEILSPMPRIGVITMSGAVCGLAADEAQLAGLELAPPGEAARILLGEMGFGGPLNPLDFGEKAHASTRPRDFKLACETLLMDEGCDALVVATGLTAQLPTMASALQALKEETTKPIYTYVVGGEVAKPFIGQMKRAGIPNFADLRQMMRALSAVGMVGSRPFRAKTTPPVAPVSEKSAAMLQAAAREPSEDNIAAYLSEIGIRYPRSVSVASAQEAAAAAQDTGFPVALKVVGPKILHKASAGVMRLSLTNTSEVRDAFEACRAAAEEQCIWAGRAVIQQMIDTRNGQELILSARRDPETGPVILIGPGGRLVEAFGKPAMLRPTLDPEAIAHVIAKNSFLSMLFGSQGQGYDRDAFTEFVRRFCAVQDRVLAAFDTIEINPLLVLENGKGCWALDASGVLSGGGLK